MRFELQRVRYMPTEFKPGVLYVSDEFDIAIHLCACGCGSKVKTPLGPTEWSVKETEAGVTLDPSVGNWQQPCQSHYWITEGEIDWARKWTAHEIATGRRSEEERRRLYYEELYRARPGLLQRLWKSVRRLLRR